VLICFDYFVGHRLKDGSYVRQDRRAFDNDVENCSLGNRESSRVLPLILGYET
jgi:hypothetical protein